MKVETKKVEIKEGTKVTLFHDSSEDDNEPITGVVSYHEGNVILTGSDWQLYLEKEEFLQLMKNAKIHPNE